MKLQQALRESTAALHAAGISSPRSNAVWLICHVFGLTPSELFTVDELPDREYRRLQDLIARRAQGTPLQHLTGRAPFRHLDLEVGPGVFIPRPETELIVELAMRKLAEAHLVVDLCAGSGAIALAVANEYPQARVVAVELSATAGEWLTLNVQSRASDGDTPIEVVLGDVRSPHLLADLAGTVDVLLSNPPYVPERIRDEVGPEIAHDPDVAVFAGGDGLGLIPDVIATAARLLRRGGLLAVEHDDTHGEAVPALLNASGAWQSVADHTDLAGRPRFATAVRS
jgi:release factor glutamine methyltransferase